MINIYDFMRDCEERGLSASEAAQEYDRAVAEERDEFMSRYFDDPVVQYGMYQQDMIDMRRRER